MASNYDGYNARPKRPAASPNDSQSPHSQPSNPKSSNPKSSSSQSSSSRLPSKQPSRKVAKPGASSVSRTGRASSSPSVRQHNPTVSSPQFSNVRRPATRPATRQAAVRPPAEPSAIYNDIPTYDAFQKKAPLYRRIPASLLGMRWLRSWPLVMLVIFGIVPPIY